MKFILFEYSYRDLQYSSSTAVLLYSRNQAIDSTIIAELLFVVLSVTLLVRVSIVILSRRSHIITIPYSVTLSSCSS